MWRFATLHYVISRQQIGEPTTRPIESVERANVPLPELETSPLASADPEV